MARNDSKFPDFDKLSHQVVGPREKILFYLFGTPWYVSTGSVLSTSMTRWRTLWGNASAKLSARKIDLVPFQGRSYEREPRSRMANIMLQNDLETQVVSDLQTLQIYQFIFALTKLSAPHLDKCREARLFYSPSKHRVEEIY